MKVTVAGKQMEWAEPDYVRCSSGYTGANPRYSPFAPEDYPMKEVLKQPYGATELPYNRVSSHMFHLNGAMEGARCMRECFIHLEEAGRIKKLVQEPIPQAQAVEALRIGGTNGSDNFRCAPFRMTPVPLCHRIVLRTQFEAITFDTRKERRHTV